MYLLPKPRRALYTVGVVCDCLVTWGTVSRAAAQGQAPGCMLTTVADRAYLYHPRRTHYVTGVPFVDDLNGLITSDQLIASAAQFLVEGGDEDAASLLLACSAEQIEVVQTDFDGPYTNYGVAVMLRGPRVAYDILKSYGAQHDKESSRLHTSIHEAISAVLPHRHWIHSLDIRAIIVAIEPGWHEELLEQARGRSVNNQVTRVERARIWNRLRFRSQTEIRIAEALDRAKVLFFPLCMARLSSSDGRVNREPDFLICKDGRWGILEVDGEEFHPPSRTTQDHERDRLFRNYGIRVIEHYDATDCFTTPDFVVKQFLRLLEQAY